MANVKLYDKNGAEQIFEGVETITLDSTVEGETETFSHGIAMDNVPIEVDFSNGDMEIDGGGYLVKSAVILKPENLMSENVAEGVNIAGVVGTHKGGGGGDYTVTFMNGSTKLYERQVLSGNTCGDVVELGLIDAPTKTPTNTIAYVQTGWSLTDGGEADSNALVNVTEDRTVYAAYEETVRLYTVRFFDGENLLYTTQVEYGKTAEYTTTKDGYIFDGWQPSNTNITADTDCYAQWAEKPTFANSSWADIAAVSEAGLAKTYYAVGDTKDVTLTNGETIQFEIWGFDHDDLSDGSGKAGISIVAKTLPSLAYDINSVESRAPSSFGLYYTAPYYLGISNKVVDLLPAELRNVTKEIVKKCVVTLVDGNDLRDINCNFWAPSHTEINCKEGSRTTNLSTLGAVYEKHKSHAQITNSMSASLRELYLLKKTPDGTAQNYWLRGRWNSTSSRPFYYISADSKFISETTTETFQNYCCIGFCV